MSGEITPYDPSLPEGWFGKVNIDNETYNLTRANTSVWTHIGALALYDHVFVNIEGQGDGPERGLYLFDKIPNQSDAYNIIGPAAANAGCKLFINMDFVSDRDKENFSKAIDYDTEQILKGGAELFDEVPDWLYPQEESKKFDPEEEEENRRPETD